MEINASYQDPACFIETITQKYGFAQRKYWNAYVLHCPDYFGEGSMQLFIRENMFFSRGKWKIFEPSRFVSPDDVRQAQHIDFRISGSGEVDSFYLQGRKRFEWEIENESVAIRLFLPKDSLPNRPDLIEKLNKYCSDKNVDRLLKQLIDEYSEDNTSFMLLEGRFLEFIHCWLKFMNGDDIERHFAEVPERQFKRLQDAKYLIEKFMDNPCSIRALSKKVNINECDLKRGFKKINGLSIHQYIIKIRMEKARDLILNTDRSIRDICTQIGYTNHGYFAQIYSKYFGAAPLKHRSHLDSNNVK